MEDFDEAINLGWFARFPNLARLQQQPRNDNRSGSRAGEEDVGLRFEE
jgi:hypothetical protein